MICSEEAHEGAGDFFQFPPNTAVFSLWAARLMDTNVIDRALADNTFDQAQEIVATEVDDDDDRVHEAGVDSRRLG